MQKIISAVASMALFADQAFAHPVSEWHIACFDDDGDYLCNRRLDAVEDEVVHHRWEGYVVCDAWDGDMLRFALRNHTLGWYPPMPEDLSITYCIKKEIVSNVTNLNECDTEYAVVFEGLDASKVIHAKFLKNRLEKIADVTCVKPDLPFDSPLVLLCDNDD